MDLFAWPIPPPAWPRSMIAPASHSPSSSPSPQRQASHSVRSVHPRVLPITPRLILLSRRTANQHPLCSSLTPSTAPSAAGTPQWTPTMRSSWWITRPNFLFPRATMALRWAGTAGAKIFSTLAIADIALPSAIIASTCSAARSIRAVPSRTRMLPFTIRETPLFRLKTRMAGFTSLSAASLPPFGGVVDIFDTDGNLLTPNHFAANAPEAGPLVNPWGIAKAPSDFGVFSNAVLIGNVEDGKINAFDPNTGAFLGSLERPNGTPIVIDGLWDFSFGADNRYNGKSNQLF